MTKLSTKEESAPCTATTWTPQITTRKNQTRTMTPNTILIVTLSGMDTELNQLSEYAIQINILPHMQGNLYLAATLETSFTVHHLVVGTTLGLRFFLRKTGKWHVGQNFEELDRRPFLTSLPLMVYVFHNLLSSSISC